MMSSVTTIQTRLVLTRLYSSRFAVDLPIARQFSTCRTPYAYP